MWVCLQSVITPCLSLKNLELGDLTLESIDYLMELKKLYVGKRVNFYVDKGPNKLILLEDLILSVDMFLVMSHENFMVNNLEAAS